MTDANLPTPGPVPNRTGLSWVWLMPLLAVLVAVGMVWKTYSDKGPVIVVTFPSATGIVAEQTPLRFRDLDVGMVESITFSEGLSAIEVHIRLDKKIAPYVDDRSQFWLVQPKVTARGITGLSTVLSGVYIEGSWDGTPTEPADYFQALSEPPLAVPGEQGTRIVLRSRSGGQLAVGAPVLFNGIEVGWIGSPVLSESGAMVTMDAFIKAPHDKRLTTATRFWDSSGLSVEVGTGGVSVNMESIASLVEGGVTFGTLVTGGEPVAAGQVFDVFPSMRAARADALEGGGTKMTVSVLLDKGVAGLSTGAPVRFEGAPVGEVLSITGYRAPGDAGGDMRLLVDLQFVPERLGIAPGPSSEALVAELAQRVKEGLRLRVASEGLLGQTVILEFVQPDEPPPGELEVGVTEYPLIPTAPASMSTSTTSVEGLVSRIGSLPIEDLMHSAIGALDSVQQLAASPDTRDIPANANALLADARALVSSDETRAALADLQAAANDLRSLTDQISASPGLASLLKALESSEQITAGVASFSDRLPGIADQIEGVATDIRAMPLAELAASIDRLVNQTDSILSAEGMDKLPETIRVSLDELQKSLSELRQGGAVTNLNKTLVAVESSIASIDASAQKIPALVDRLDALAASLQGAVAGYAPGSRIHGDLTNAVRNISGAADAFRSLATTIERNPSALITGGR